MGHYSIDYDVLELSLRNTLDKRHWRPSMVSQVRPPWTQLVCAPLWFPKRFRALERLAVGRPKTVLVADEVIMPLSFDRCLVFHWP